MPILGNCTQNCNHKYEFAEEDTIIIWYRSGQIYIHQTVPRFVVHYLMYGENEEKGISLSHFYNIDHRIWHVCVGLHLLSSKMLVIPNIYAANMLPWQPLLLHWHWHLLAHPNITLTNDWICSFLIVWLIIVS